MKFLNFKDKLNMINTKQTSLHFNINKNLFIKIIIFNKTQEIFTQNKFPEQNPNNKDELKNNKFKDSIIILP